MEYTIENKTTINGLTVRKLHEFASGMAVYVSVEMQTDKTNHQFHVYKTSWALYFVKNDKVKCVQYIKASEGLLSGKGCIDHVWFEDGSDLDK